MKIEQQATEYRPITITLETKEEARAFIQLIDRVGSVRCQGENQAWVVREISNAFSNDLALP